MHDAQYMCTVHDALLLGQEHLLCMAEQLQRPGWGRGAALSALKIGSSVFLGHR